MKEYIVFVSKEHYNPLGIVRTLGENGISPIVVIVEGELKFVGQSKYVKKKHYVLSTEEGIKLIMDQYAREDEKSFILTGDDVTVSALDRHFNELERFFYFFNAGEQGRVTHYMNKDNMIEAAKKHGLNVARTWKVKVGNIPPDIEYPVMTKAVNSFGIEWKDIVFICKNNDELITAFSKMKSEEVLLQRYIEKVNEVSFDGFSVDHGKQTVILTEVYQEYCIPDKYSPYWIVRNNADLHTTAIIKDIIREIGWEGIFEFEFLVDKDGKLWFLEINFRNTALGYSTTAVGMPQAILWCDSMEKRHIDQGLFVQIPEGFHAMAECFDYDARVKTGMVSKKEWMSQYRACQCKLYKGHDDIVPFFRFMWYKLTKMRQ
jgi:D-aspartate ligase